MKRGMIILFAVPFFLFGLWWGYQNTNAENTTKTKVTKAKAAKAKVVKAVKAKAKVVVMKECDIILSVSGMT